MALQVAKLVKGSETPAGDGVTGANRCVITTASGEKKAAILKKGPIQQIAAEAFCAILLKEWGLNVPTPYLVPLGNDFGFASSDTGYPNLKQSLGIDQIPNGPAKEAAYFVACQLAVEFKSTPTALAADEAIGNRDRNLGNILWDGKEEAWIDHAFCLQAGEAALPDANKLATMAILTQKTENIARSAVTQALYLDREKITLAGSAVDSYLGETCTADFVAKRITQLANMIIARFPQPAGLL